MFCPLVKQPPRGLERRLLAVTSRRGGNGCLLLPLPPDPAAGPREGRASSGAKQQRLAEELGVQLLRKRGSGACPA